MATILTITGSDGTGGSGIQADIQTITALGGRAVSAITSVTIQNTLGIQDFYDLPANIVRGQIEAIINDIQPDTVRIGLIRNAETLLVVVELLRKYRPKHVIYDPIVRASSGDELLSGEILTLIQLQLLPLCSVVVLRKEEEEMIFGGQQLPDVCRLFLDRTKQHGLANSISSALAVFLNQEMTIETAIRKAQQYVGTLVRDASDLKGRSHQLYNDFLEAINRHLTTNHDVAFYADCLNVSPRYLSQVTHRVAGASPKNIIDKLLTDAIIQRLQSTMLTIQELAYTFKFGSQAQFAKYFKKQTGFSPSEYRRKQKA